MVARHPFLQRAAGVPLRPARSSAWNRTILGQAAGLSVLAHAALVLWAAFVTLVGAVAPPRMPTVQVEAHAAPEVVEVTAKPIEAAPAPEAEPELIPVVEAPAEELPQLLEPVDPWASYHRAFATPPPPQPAEPRPQREPLRILPALQPPVTPVAEAADPAPAQAVVRYLEPETDPERCPPPEYPRAAQRRGLEGAVQIRVAVSAEGWPLEVVLVRSSGHAILDRAALDAVRAWRFRPARREGQDVAGDKLLAFRFQILD